MGSPLYVLEIEIERLRARVFINQIEVFAEATGRQRRAAAKINQYIVEGKNQLDVVLGPDVVLSDEGKPTLRTGGFELTLLHGQHGTEPGEEGRLLHYRWNAAETPLLLPTQVPVFRREFVAKESFGRWLWQDAAPYRDEDAPAIAKLVRTFYQTLLQRDGDALSVLCRQKTQELARALDVPVQELEVEQAEFYASYLRSPSWQLTYVSPEELVLTPMAGGRIVSITGPGGAPVLKGTDGERPFVMELKVAKLKGRWTLVR